MTIWLFCLLRHIFFLKCWNQNSWFWLSSFRPSWRSTAAGARWPRETAPPCSWSICRDTAESHPPLLPSPLLPPQLFLPWSVWEPAVIRTLSGETARAWVCVCVCAYKCRCVCVCVCCGSAPPPLSLSLSSLPPRGWPVGDRPRVSVPGWPGQSRSEDGSGGTDEAERCVNMLVLRLGSL